MCGGTGVLGRPPRPGPADLVRLPEAGGEADPVAARQRSETGGGPAEVTPSAADKRSPVVSLAGVRVLWGNPALSLEAFLLLDGAVTVLRCSSGRGRDGIRPSNR